MERNGASTISQAVIAFLATYKELEVNADYLSEMADQSGLVKSETRTVKECIGGEHIITESYQFYATQKSAEGEKLKDTDEWLEELIYWADDYALQYEYPELTGGRHIEKINLTGVPYARDTENDEIIYKMVLTITYVREREDY